MFQAAAVLAALLPAESAVKVVGQAQACFPAQAKGGGRDQVEARRRAVAAESRCRAMVAVVRPRVVGEARRRAVAEEAPGNCMLLAASEGRSGPVVR